MDGDPDPKPILSWKDKLLGGFTIDSSLDHTVPIERSENDFELLEGDVNTTIIDGVPTITFSDRIKNNLFREMKLTVIVKLLGRNISYNALHNRILSLWKLVNSIRIMDTTNKYFLVKFQAIEDYNRVIVDGAIQRVEYEALPTVCFACGKYGHVKEMCTMAVIEQNLVVPHRESSCGVDSSNRGKSDDDSMVSRSKEKEPEFGPWMLVEKRYSRRGKRDFLMEVMEKQSKQPLGIRFSVLMGEEDFIGEGGSVDGGFLRENENRKVAANLKGFKPSVSKNIEGVSLDKAGHRVNNGMGLPNRSNMKKGLGSENLEGMGQMSKDILNKYLGKRPMGLDGLDNNNEESSDKLPISNFSNFVSAVLNCVDSQNDTHFDVVGAQGPLASKNQTNIDAEDLEKIKAHYNPVFDESESFIVPISDNTLDPWNRFKTSGNMRIPLAESMEAMA
ncbi:hypothetical protein PVK06_024934 [Gossypium arboreum]|uniref:CCHC-type domain-containing protein n=1 Tax=Gossypium arboreum TaxID=29729 RepID=A0ABR0PF55_GOSAR|nr:hypothetical protein PVK06_024934 [Gossypium arboreum]